MRKNRITLAHIVALAGLVLASAGGMAQATVVGGPVGSASEGAGDWEILEQYWTSNLNGSFTPATNGFGAGTLYVLEQANSLGPLDLVITIQDIGVGQSVDFELVKEVINNSDFNWTDFHFEIGTGTGVDFVLSDEYDGLYFYGTGDGGLDPEETTGKFQNPPGQDEASAPDALWWYGYQPVGHTSRFVVGIHARDSNDGDLDGNVTFTVRQTATVAVPEPATLSLLGLGALALVRRRKRTR